MQTPKTYPLLDSSTETTYRIVELFCGIGGFRLAMDIAGLQYTTVAAVDIDEDAKLVYAHNFQPGDHFIKKTLQSIEKDKLQAIIEQADILFASPPCQPFTKTGNRKHEVDGRCGGLLYLLEAVLLDDLNSCMPRYMLFENVNGFQDSTSRDLLVRRLRMRGYAIEEYLLSPIQIGIPNSRLRYYLLASSPQNTKDSVSVDCEREENPYRLALDIPDDCVAFVRLIRPDLFLADNDNNSDWKACSNSDRVATRPVPLRLFLQSARDTDEHRDWLKRCMIDQPTKDKYLAAMDVVSGESRRSMCFTKAYGRYFKWTGSVYRDDDDEDEQVLRYFTPAEVKALMGFPPTFQFPAMISSLKRQYQMLGNSINTLLVASLIRHLVIRHRT